MGLDMVKPVREITDDELVATGLNSSDPYFVEIGRRLAESGIPALRASKRPHTPWRIFWSEQRNRWVIATRTLEPKVIASVSDHNTARALVEAHNGV